MLIREANQTDFNDLVPLLAELGYQISEDEIRTQGDIYISSKDCELLVAQTDMETLSGFVAGHLFPLIHQPGNVGRIMALVVGKRYQSQGVGSSLSESLEAWFKENNCIRFEVNSGDHRTKAYEFYQSKGYQIDERRFAKPNIS